jgi:hypothetical protein
MVIKRGFFSAIWNTVLVLVVAGAISVWWTSPKRQVSAVDIRDVIHDQGVRHERITPIREPASWATAGKVARDGTFATALLITLATLAIWRDWPHRVLSWLAVLASLAMLAGAVTFIALRPDLGPLRPGFTLIATIGSWPLAFLCSYGLTRAPWPERKK